MKTSKIIIALLLLSYNSYSQSKQKLEIESEAGYDYNYFKSPEKLERNNELLSKNELIKSSVFQSFTADYDYQYKWRENRIRFSAKPSLNLYYENIDDSYWSIYSFIKYDRDLTKKTSLIAETSIKRMNREGLDGDQDVLINPLGYTNYNASAGIKTKLLKDNKTVIEGVYNFRNYDAYGIRDLEYKEMGVEFKSEQKFDKNRKEHKYGLTAYAKKRLYKTYNSSNIPAIGDRNWNYLKATAYYKYPLSNNLYIEPKLEIYKRIDTEQNNSSFSQYGPTLEIDFKNKQTRISSLLKYHTRNYVKIDARDNNGLIGENLQYKYTSLRLSAEHKIGDNISIIANIIGNLRATNYTNTTARSFRDYNNYVLSTGLIWEL